MVLAHSTFRIYKKVVRMAQLLQVEDDYPIYSNDSLVIALAVYRLCNDWEMLTPKQQKLEAKRIIDDIKVMKEDGVIDENARGYNRK